MSTLKFDKKYPLSPSRHRRSPLGDQRPRSRKSGLVAGDAGYIKRRDAVRLSFSHASPNSIKITP